MQLSILHHTFTRTHSLLTLMTILLWAVGINLHITYLAMNKELLIHKHTEVEPP